LRPRRRGVGQRLRGLAALGPGRRPPHRPLGGHRPGRLRRAGPGLRTGHAPAGLGLWTRTRPLGMASLAIGEDPAAARLLGVRPQRVTAVIWGLSALLAG